jgi:hypothetical protein
MAAGRTELHNLSQISIPWLQGTQTVWYALLRPETVYTTRKSLYSGTGTAVPLRAMKALWGRGGTAPTHSRPRH